MPKPCENSRFKAGQKIGPYTLLACLGEGTYGEVWKAERNDVLAAPPVALKVSRYSGQHCQAVHDEANRWVSVSGLPNILPVIEANEYGSEVVIVSQYIEDGTLNHWLRRHGGKAPSLDAAISIMAGILTGLEGLHGKGIVHRDLKPDNVLMQGDMPLLTDFGISRIVEHTSAYTQQATGTIGYFPPEAFLSSEAKSKVSKKSDQWAAAILLFRLLTGKLPFPQSEWGPYTYAVMNQEPPPLPGEVPPHVRRAVATALAKDPDLRFESAAAMRAALLTPDRAAVPAAPPAAQPRAPQAAAPLPRSGPELPSRLDSLGYIAGGIVLLASVGGTLAYFNSDRNPSGAARNASETGNDPPGSASGGSSGSNTDTPADNTGDSSEASKTGGGAESHNDSSAQTSTASSSANPKTKTNPIDNAEMILIPAGDFIMGSSDYKDEMFANDSSDSVYLDAYYIYKYEVTVQQYLDFCETDEAKRQGIKKPTAPDFNKNWEKTDHPIVNVTWKEADAYCKWAGGSLPTEAQWEKAARGSDGRKYPWDNDWDASKCQCSKTSYGDSGGTAAVGSYSDGVSPYGVHDMAGNVWEWCNDFYREDYYRTAPNRNPSGPESGAVRVLRGGSWVSNDTNSFRCSNRDYYYPSSSDDNIGFRCVLRSDS